MKKKEHKHTAGIKSYKQGNYFVFMCACGKELGKDILINYNHKIK